MPGPENACLAHAVLVLPRAVTTPAAPERENRDLNTRLAPRRTAGACGFPQDILQTIGCVRPAVLPGGVGHALTPPGVGQQRTHHILQARDGDVASERRGRSDLLQQSQGHALSPVPPIPAAASHPGAGVPGAA